MNRPATLGVSTQPLTAEGLRGALCEAVQHVSWRVVGATLAIAVALDVWLLVELAYEQGSKLPTAEGYLSGAIVNLLMAFCIMFTTLVADELVARGAKRIPAYAWAVVIGSAVAALAQWEVHEWLHLRTRNDLPDIPREVTITQPAIMFFEYLIWGSIIVFIYVHRRTALRATARMNAAQVQRADAQRRTLESRLQALQARIEPQFLFNTLAQVRELYERDPAKGGEMLGDLIVYLRAALPHLRESSSTLGQEVELASAYLNIMQVRLGGRLAFDIDMPQAVLSAYMPPMILLPLLDHALAHGLASSTTGVTIRIAVHSSASKLRVEIADSGSGFAAGGSGDGLRDIQDRLHALYGDRGRLTFGPADGYGTHAVMEIPHESADGHHR
ncbi:MAG TPA: histidine kinase [Casimicrobiaceae bacterium]